MRKNQSSLLKSIVFWSVLTAAWPVLAQAANEKIAIGPYLQNPAPDAMTVMFCTDAPGPLAVAYGQAEDRLDRKVAALPCGEESPRPYKARIEGVPVGSRWFYRIVDAGGEAFSKVESFTTLDPQANSVKAVFFNDLHDQVQLMQALRPWWQDTNPDFVLFNGDCWGDPQRGRSMRTLAGVVSECPAASRPMLFLRGNHECRGPWQEGLLRYFDLPLGQQKKYYFAFTQGPVRFVCLDCGEDYHKAMEKFQPYREEELEWIKEEVASDEFRQATYRVLVTHIPLYGELWYGDWPHPNLPEPLPEEVNTSLPSHKMWSPVLDEAGIDLCLAGHSHIPILLTPGDSRANQNPKGSGTNPYAVLVGGGPAVAAAEVGTVIILEADERELRVRSIGVDGRTIHEYRRKPQTRDALRAATAAPRMLELTLRTRDQETNQPVLTKENVDAEKVGVVIVDPWNYHWCMTACERVSAMAPRWNRALQCARQLGMPILWVPSDVVGSYSGYPQRERALGVKLLPVPKAREIPPAQLPGGGCMCGPGFRCMLNYGFDAINGDLFLAEDDLIASSTEEVYSLLKQRGITHVIYMGLHTNMCLFGKPGALKYMVQAGLKCMLARDINDALTYYNPATGFTPDRGTQQTDEALERAGVPTINVVEEWRHAGVWNDNWIVETVRITPWGKPKRPYVFEQSVVVKLTAPWLRDVEIRYTLDGSEPGAASPLYSEPLTLSETTSLRTAAFRAGKSVSIPTDAYFVHLPARPPSPDVYLDDLKYILDPYVHYSPGALACFWQPKIGKSYEGLSLRVRGHIYEKGLGFRAPSAVRYELKPEYERFVALAGIADNMLDHDWGRNLARHCSVVFKVFIDGEQAAESPVMRISQEPWRFDVAIAPDSRFINLVCMDAGSRNILDLGNWVDAGFVLSGSKNQERKEH